jgi:hypothetical protein
MLVHVPFSALNHVVVDRIPRTRHASRESPNVAKYSRGRPPTTVREHRLGMNLNGLVAGALAAAALVAACSTCQGDRPAPPPSIDPTPPTPRSISATTPQAPARRWLAGDLHMHVAPPDDPSDVQLSLAEIARRAREAALDFVVLTPHLWPERRGPKFDAAWREMATSARAQSSPILIPGIEWSTPLGHFTIAGVDVTKLGRDPLASAHDRGAFVSVNHPFAVPHKLPLRIAHFDMSYRAWTATPRAATAPIDGVEVWNVPLALANLISRPGGGTGEERAWREADRVARAEGRRLTAVGGTDNHALMVMATTWVLAAEATETAILDALRAGATCVGGPDAGTLQARGEDDWVGIGGTVRAERDIALVWDGLARLFVDGVDRGEHAGGFVHAADGLRHTYRIVVGASRSGFIYANL